MTNVTDNFPTGTVALPDAFIGVPYHVPLTGGVGAVGSFTAGAFTVSQTAAVAGETGFPAGVVVNADEVAVTGTPTGVKSTSGYSSSTEIAGPGTYTFHLTFAVSSDTSLNQAFTITLHDASELPEHDTELPSEDVEAANNDSEWPVVQ